MRSGCLEESTVIAFLGGALSPDARATVEQHIDACSACADLLTWAASDQASTTSRLPGREGRPFVGDLHPGTRVGRYQILGAVGRGGMGEVYAAYHPDLDRRIALKVVGSRGARSDERRARLLREARAVARLSHPNVVTVHDAGTFGDRVFIAMELIDGLTIDDWLRAEPRTWQQILDVFVAAGRGLAAAHAAGVVHRDFKPQNVMIAKSGAVRVMDFGLARLALDDAGDHDDEPGADSPPLPVTSVTKTGAIVGTPAYMSPEQFRREGVDARSDQFSFSVALHEALYGARPQAALDGMADPPPEPSMPLPRGGVPIWLRAVVRRGASVDRQARYGSMDDLIAALERGRTRLRRRAWVVAVGLVTLLLGPAAWWVGRANRFVCAVPRDRVAGVWTPGAGADGRRQSIHRAFATSGRATAETSWERLSKVLDDYMNAWSAMYVQTCEATHLRGEQSAAVLDLRMSCLADDLDQVRALTDTLAAGDSEALSHAVTAALDLTPVKRCENVALLKSAVPLPRDERTLRQVELLRKSIRDAEALRGIGRYAAALDKVVALRPRAEATGYTPLMGEVAAQIGLIQADLFSPDAEKTLEEAVFLADAARDDATRAKAATSLIYAVALQPGRIRDSDRWERLAMAALDRLGNGHERTRAWALHDYATVLAVQGQFEKANALFEQAIALKEQALGKDHPDVALSLEGLASNLCDLDRPAEALPVSKRALSILEVNSDPASPLLANALIHHAEVFVALGRHPEARQLLQRARDIVRGIDAEHPFLASAAEDLGKIELADGHPATAIPLLEQALRMYEKYPGISDLIANTRFALARALTAQGTDRKRALALAESARDLYATGNRPRREREVAAWLSSHGRRSSGSAP